MIKDLTPIICACLVAAMAMFAVSQGIDGAVLAGCCTIVGGLGGYQLKRAIDIYTSKNK